MNKEFNTMLLLAHGPAPDFTTPEHQDWRNRVTRWLLAADIGADAIGRYYVIRQYERWQEALSSRAPARRDVTRLVT